MKKLLIIGGGLAGLGVLAIVAVVVVFMLRSDDPNLLTEAPAIPTPGVDVAPTSSIATTTTTTTASGGVRHFVIDQSGSQAKYVVKETLRGVANAQAVGTTNAITGDIYLTSDGLAAGQISKFSVDLRRLQTDESLRDNYVRQDVLQTNRFPTAEFVAESITGFPPNYVEGTEVEMTLRGTLTIHGVSKQVQWAVKARHASGTLTGIANISFNMSEYGIKPPSVPTARAEDGVQLRITILAKLAV